MFQETPSTPRICRGFFRRGGVPGGRRFAALFTEVRLAVFENRGALRKAATAVNACAKSRTIRAYDGKWRAPDALISLFRRPHSEAAPVTAAGSNLDRPVVSRTGPATRTLPAGAFPCWRRSTPGGTKVSCKSVRGRTPAHPVDVASTSATRDDLHGYSIPSDASIALQCAKRFRPAAAATSGLWS
jgi:hypothetical protein